MTRNKILLTGNPKGNLWSGIISGTPKPGTCMTIKAGVAPVGGLMTWEAYNPSADSDPRLCAVLLENDETGQGPTDAYVSGSIGKIYCPIPGDQLNMLIAAAAGTGSANVFTVGERMTIVHATGKLIAQGTSASRAPFQLIEKTTETIQTDGLAACIFGSF